MKTFASHKTSAEVFAQCEAQGVPVNRHHFDRGGDTIVVGQPWPLVLEPNSPAYAIYNVVNGQFFGRTDKGVAFNSNSTEHENEPWFQALLAFFYVEKK